MSIMYIQIERTEVKSQKLPFLPFFDPNFEKKTTLMGIFNPKFLI